MGATSALSALDKIKAYANSVSKNKPGSPATLTDSTDPKVLWSQVKTWCKAKHGEKLRCMVEYLPEAEDSQFLTGARFYFLNELAERWYSIEVRLVVNEQERVKPTAHWVRNALQIEQK